MLGLLSAVRHIWFAYRLNYAQPLDEPKLEAALETWRRRIGVARRPRYVFSHIVSSVCVYGVFRPTVILPFNLLDRISIDDAALMGAHEMAHIKRGDVALFALCSIAKAVFWFNPFMHQICARANLAAEQGADALVLASGVNRRQYAQCFVQGLRLAANSRNGFTGELIPSFTPFDKRSRRQRLDAILSGGDTVQKLNLSAKAGLAVSAGLATVLACAQAAFAVAPPSVREALPVTPVNGEVSFGFGEQSKLLGADRIAHEGIDIRAARGEAVRAAGAGKIVAATDRYHGSKSWGNVVAIDHGHGLVTRYAHLDSYTVKKGDQVAAGDVIGAVGSSGVASGPHLHFEVISDGQTVDPAPIAAPAAAPKARMTISRSVTVAPAPAAVEAPAPVASPQELEPRKPGKNSHKLDSRQARFEDRMRKMFEDFNAFGDLEGMELAFNDIDLEGFKGASEWAAQLDGKEFTFRDFPDFSAVQPNFQKFVEEARLSKEEIESLSEDAREAMIEAKKEAREARREALAAITENERERLQAERERAHERAERERERAQREREHEQGRAQRERDRALREHDRAERERTRAEKVWKNDMQSMMSEEEILAVREKAIRDARNDLDQELAEIERRRKELKRSERRSD